MARPLRRPLPRRPLRRVATAASVALAVLLVLAASASAQSGSIHDPAGDAPASLDMVEIAWEVQGGHATVTLHLAAAPAPDASYTAILFLGTEGAAEPQEWYILHSGPGGDRVLAGHAEPVVESEPAVQRGNTILAFTFDRVSAAASPCAFAVAQSWTGGDGDRNVADAVPDRTADLATAWGGGQLCGQTTGQDDPVQRSPAPAIGILLAALLLWAWLRRG